MMLAHVGLDEASRLLTAAIEATVREGVMTYDLARQIDGVIPVSCSVFGNEVTKRIGKTQ
jgi:isocitrate dehydrogenase